MSTPAFDTVVNMSSPLPLSVDDHSPHFVFDGPPGVLPSSLPYPDPSYLSIPPERKKKSHARKQPPGHIPRPRNAFILFRCDFVRQKKVPGHVEANHQNISRIVGSVWRNMSTSQKAPWIEMADMEKKNHAKAHPGYKYHPGSEGRGKGTRGKELSQSPADSSSRMALEPSVRAEWTPSPSCTPPLIPLRRSSSCPPPGALPVPNTTSFGLPQIDTLGISAPLVTRDDLARRPSRTVMYQSNMLQNFFINPPMHSAPPALYSVDTPDFLWTSDPGSGAPLTSGPYTIAPPGDAPGWDAAPTKPDASYAWSDAVLGAHVGNIESYNFGSSFPSEWSIGPGRPTFTNPFDSAHSMNESLAWNFDPSSVPESIDMHAGPTGLPPSAFSSADHTQPPNRAEVVTVEDLGDLLRSRMSLVKGDQIFPDIAKAERHSPLLSEAQEEKPMIQDDRMIYSTYQESLHALAYPAGPERAGDLFHGLPDEKQQNLGSKGGFLVDYLEDHSGGHYPVVNQAQGQFRSKNEGPSTASFLANMPPLSFIASSSSLPTSSLPGGTQMPEIWRTEGGFSKEG